MFAQHAPGAIMIKNYITHMSLLYICAVSVCGAAKKHAVRVCDVN